MIEQKIKPAWLKSKDEFGEEVKVLPVTKDSEVLVHGGTNLEEEIESIYEAIDSISLTPGPPGPQGLRGEKGAKGIIVSETEPTDPEIELWIEPQFNIDHIIDLSQYYTKPEVDEKVDDLDERLTPLEYQVDELLTPLNINSFTCSPNLIEIGTTIPVLTLQWTYNRDIKRQFLEGQEIDVTLRETQLEGFFETNQTFTLKAEGYSKSVQKQAQFQVMNQVYFGSSVETSSIEALLKNLSKELRDTRKKTFTTNAQEGEYIYYLYPSRYGQAKFFVGGFEGGFNLFSTVEIVNSSGYEEFYHIYRSANPNLGQTTVTVE